MPYTIMANGKGSKNKHYDWHIVCVLYLQNALENYLTLESRTKIYRESSLDEINSSISALTVSVNCVAGRLKGLGLQVNPKNSQGQGSSNCTPVHTVHRG